MWRNEILFKNISVKSNKTLLLLILWTSTALVSLNLFISVVYEFVWHTSFPPYIKWKHIHSPCIYVLTLQPALSPSVSICCSQRHLGWETVCTQRAGCVGWTDGGHGGRLKREKVRLRKEKSVRWRRHDNPILRVHAYTFSHKNTGDTNGCLLDLIQVKVNLYTLFPLQI